MIRIDFTQISVVALCQECGWRVIRSTKAEAWNSGHSHQLRAHGQAGNAYDAMLKARKRAQ